MIFIDIHAKYICHIRYSYVVLYSRFVLFQPSGWRKVRNMVQWTPFIQTFKNRKYQWVQLAGHSGNFKAGRSQGTVLKKLCPQEESCYVQFANDSLQPYVPEFQGTLVLDNEESKSLSNCSRTCSKYCVICQKIDVDAPSTFQLGNAINFPANSCNKRLNSCIRACVFRNLRYLVVVSNCYFPQGRTSCANKLLLPY